VPRDLSVVGITDIQLAQQSRPPLTTVAVPTVEAAELAVSLLRELIERPSGKHGAHQKAPRVCVTSEPQLIVRGSTRKR
jgi:DNA-binding LacI/PurR family transcriptional regulator